MTDQCTVLVLYITNNIYPSTGIDAVGYVTTVKAIEYQLAEQNSGAPQEASMQHLNISFVKHPNTFLKSPKYAYSSLFLPPNGSSKKLPNSLPSVSQSSQVASLRNANWEQYGRTSN